MSSTEVKLNVEEAAKYLGMKPHALRMKAKNGEVPAAKPGKEWVFLLSDLISHIRKLYSSREERFLKDDKWQLKVKNSLNVGQSGTTGSRIQELRLKSAVGQIIYVVRL